MNYIYSIYFILNIKFKLNKLYIKYWSNISIFNIFTFQVIWVYTKKLQKNWQKFKSLLTENLPFCCRSQIKHGRCTSRHVRADVNDTVISFRRSHDQTWHKFQSESYRPPLWCLSLTLMVANNCGLYGNELQD